jgi:hypothetical protein
VGVLPMGMHIAQSAHLKKRGKPFGDHHRSRDRDRQEDPRMKRQGRFVAPMGALFLFTLLSVPGCQVWDAHHRAISEAQLLTPATEGRPSAEDTGAFIEKLDQATSGQFQLTTDGFAAYPEAVHYSLGTRVDFAQLVKVYGAPQDPDQRYSPASVISAIPMPRWGTPDPQQICTAHVERQNLTMRMQLRRLTRLSNAFSEKWENLKAALAVYFAHYNFIRVHTTLRITPAMQAGLSNHIWTWGELLENERA